jgi:AcrR family transcriptional regulator
VARPRFTDTDFLSAALAIAAESGPLGATVASITGRLKAPTGSFYHRFASRDVLLGELWLRTVIDFQRGIGDALDAGDGLRAALHTPVWVREHFDEARLLLLYHRDDFVEGEWPEALRDRVAEQTRRAEAELVQFARLIFGRQGRQELRRAQFLLAEVPVAAVSQHLRRRELPPPIIDELITATFRAVVSDYQTVPIRRRGGQTLPMGKTSVGALGRNYNVANSKPSKPKMTHFHRGRE